MKNVLFLHPVDLVVGLEGPRGPFGTGKSSCMCRVATISLQGGQRRRGGQGRERGGGGLAVKREEGEVVVPEGENGDGDEDGDEVLK